MSIENSLSKVARDQIAVLTAKKAELNREIREIDTQLDALFPKDLKAKALDEIPAKMKKMLKGDEQSIILYHDVRDIFLKKEEVMRILPSDLYEKVRRESHALQVSAGV